MSRKDMHIVLEAFDKADASRLPEGEDKKGKGKARINLTKDTAPEEVDTLLRVLIGYNSGYKLDEREAKDPLFGRLYRKLDKRKLVLPGGIHFEGDGSHIYPGCCCGMEDWMDIVSSLKKQRSPSGWKRDLGVFFLEKDGICYLSDVRLTKYNGFRSCSRNGNVRRSVNIEEALLDGTVSIIGWKEESFYSSLDRLEGDFKEFLNGPLQKRMEQLAGKERARQFVRAFARCFQRHKKRYKEGIELTV